MCFASCPMARAECSDLREEDGMSKLDETILEIEMLRKCVRRLERRIGELRELKLWLSYSDEEAVQEASKVIAEEAARSVAT